MSDKVKSGVNLERVIGAEIWKLDAAYIDYFCFDNYGKRHRFAFIKRTSFSDEDYAHLMNTLRNALIENERINLLIESREKEGQDAYQDYVLKAS
jgi:hypothetical protein